MHYRVYPNIGRGRAFRSLDRAIRFAGVAYGRQGIADIRPVAVVSGTASTFCKIGQAEMTGWQWTEDAPVFEAHAYAAAERLALRGCVFSAAAISTAAA
jgi:hypothetical protein